MTIIEIRERLKALAEPRFQAFAASLIPGETRLLGVRLPLLRSLAKQLAKGKELRTMAGNAPESMEETMLFGMLPGYAQHIPYETRMEAIRRFVPYITNWSICDSCCATYKFIQQHRPEAWTFLLPYLHSTQEFEARFGLVMLLNHFVKDEKWIPEICSILPELPCKGYYAEMAAAWLICEMHVRYPSYTHALLSEESCLRPDIRSRSFRKIRESHRKVQ